MSPLDGETQPEASSSPRLWFAPEAKNSPAWQPAPAPNPQLLQQPAQSGVPAPSGKSGGPGKSASQPEEARCPRQRSCAAEAHSDAENDEGLLQRASLQLQQGHSLLLAHTSEHRSLQAGTFGSPGVAQPGSSGAAAPTGVCGPPGPNQQQQAGPQAQLMQLLSTGLKLRQPSPSPLQRPLEQGVRRSSVLTSLAGVLALAAALQRMCLPAPALLPSHCRALPHCSWHLSKHSLPAPSDWAYRCMALSGMALPAAAAPQKGTRPSCEPCSRHAVAMQSPCSSFTRRCGFGSAGPQGCVVQRPIRWAISV